MADVPEKSANPEDSWFHVDVRPGVNADLPGIYEWRIEGEGCYIGQYTHKSRPLKEYETNVEHKLNKKPYRKSKPGGFRKIHHELAEAKGKISVTLIFLENQPDKAERNRREGELIAQRRRDEESGGPRVLNATKAKSGH